MKHLSKRTFSILLGIILAFSFLQFGVLNASTVSYTQLVTPNPNIPCTPGWCLMYVRQTFGAPAVEPNATTAWNNSIYKHQDMDFPAGCYVPIWFSVRNVPEGHVALLCPDGSVYSSSSATSTTPVHHPSINALISYYASANPLTYLGWSEDISTVRVVSPQYIPPKPTTASISISKPTVAVGQNVTFSFSANNSPSFVIGIDKDATRIDTKDCGTSTSYTRSFSAPGNYSAYVTAWNSAGGIDSGRIYFTVANLPGKPTLSVGSVYKSTQKVAFSWANTSDTTCYDLRILQNGSVVKTVYSIVGTSYSVQLPVGNYTAYLCSVNTKYADWWTKGNDVSFSVVATPGIPANLAASSAGFDSIKLNWTAVSGATGYEIYRSTTLVGGFVKIASATTANYTNNGLTTNRTYYYKIRAYGTVGSTNIFGGYTNPVSAKPIPSVPTGLKAVSAGYSSIKLSWSAVSGATGYDVFRSATAVGGFTKITSTTTAAYTNTGLTINTTYYYKIRAYRSVGSTIVYGSYTSPVSAKPIPSVPTSLKAVSAGYSSIKLTWTAVSGATGYEIYRSVTAVGGFTKIASATIAAYTNTGLTTNTTYYYKIRAYRTIGLTNGYGGYTAAVSAKPIPSVPAGLKAVSTGYSSIKLTWTTTPGANGYEIYRSIALAGTYSSIGTTTSPSYSNTGLTACTSYYYKIRAYTNVGTAKVFGDYSPIAAGTTAALSISDGTYHIVSMVSSSQYLNGYSDSSTAFPWQVTTAPTDGSTEQIFVFSKQADGSYILTIQRYNKVLTVNGAITAGTKFISTTNSGSTSQRFILTRKSGDYYTISPYGYPNLVLAKTSTKTYSNTEHYFIQLEEYTGTSNQYWQLSTLP